MKNDTTLNPLDKRLLTRVQSDFPLSADPYSDLGVAAGCSSEEAHARILHLRRTGVIRRIGGSFAAQPLGYVSTLVAGRVDPARIETAAARAGSFPEVTHNYEREDEYNLWFTVIAADRARLEHILKAVSATDGVHELHDLPSLRLFKIKVDFTFGDNPPSAPVAEGPRSDALGSTAQLTTDCLDRRIIHRACGDVGESRGPFGDLSAELGISEPELLERLMAYRNHGAMRRFGAVLRHRAAGFTGNGMSVWNVPESDACRVGEFLAACPEISHCYERPRFQGWPYNLFGMIHGRDRPGCQSFAESIAREMRISDYRVLFSKSEFKKTSMVYFAEAGADGGH